MSDNNDDSGKPGARKKLAALDMVKKAQDFKRAKGFLAVISEYKELADTLVGIVVAHASFKDALVQAVAEHLTKNGEALDALLRNPEFASKLSDSLAKSLQENPAFMQALMADATKKIAQNQGNQSLDPFSRWDREETAEPDWDGPGEFLPETKSLAEKIAMESIGMISAFSASDSRYKDLEPFTGKMLTLDGSSSALWTKMHSQRSEYIGSKKAGLPVAGSSLSITKIDATLSFVALRVVTDPSPEEPWNATRPPSYVYLIMPSELAEELSVSKIQSGHVISDIFREMFPNFAREHPIDIKSFAIDAIDRPVGELDSIDSKDRPVGELDTGIGSSDLGGGGRRGSFGGGLGSL